MVIRVEMPFNSLMTEFFEGSNVEVQICIFAQSRGKWKILKCLRMSLR